MPDLLCEEKLRSNGSKREESCGGRDIKSDGTGRYDSDIMHEG